jgi:hypothetical protein
MERVSQGIEDRQEMSFFFCRWKPGLRFRSKSPHRQDTLDHVGEGDAKGRSGSADDAKRSHAH